MRLSKERLEESIELIRKHLVKSHTDKDGNSLFVRFAEICNEVEDLQFEIGYLNRLIKILNVCRGVCDDDGEDCEGV